MNSIVGLPSVSQMLQVYSPQIQYIVVPEAATIPTTLLQASTRWSTVNHALAVVYAASTPTEEAALVIAHHLNAAGFVRAFEHCWLPADQSEDVRAHLVQALFSTIAEKYDELITTERNCGCYEYLYMLAKQNKRSAGSRTLDFGCGTGIITRTGFVHELDELKGFDSSPQMAHLAVTKGVPVIFPPADHLEGHRFDIILSAYVMHFGIPSADIVRLVHLLEVGGVLIANFHKEINLAETLVHLREAQIDGLQWTVESSLFGPVLSIMRIPTSSGATC